MTTRHTPGPWSVCEVSPHGATVRSDGAHGISIAQCSTNATFSADGAPAFHVAREAAANAHLIAAAPDLLAALQAFADEIVPNNPNDPLWTNARAAIAKATGEA